MEIEAATALKVQDTAKLDLPVASSSTLARPGDEDRATSLADEGIGVLPSHGSHSLPLLPVELLATPNDTAITRLAAAASEDMVSSISLEFA